MGGIIKSLICSKSATDNYLRKIELRKMGYLQRKQIYNFVSLFSRGQLLKERICSSRSKFFPLKVDPRSKSYLIQRSIHASYYKIIFRKGAGVFVRAGAFIRINMVCRPMSRVSFKVSLYKHSAIPGNIPFINFASKISMR